MSTEQRARWVLVGAIVISLLVHGATSVALALLPSAVEWASAAQRGTIEFEVEADDLPPVEQPEVEPEAPTADAEAPPTPRDETPPPRRDPNTPTPPETNEPPAPLAEQVEAFDGLVLTGTGSGTGWTTAVGSGQDARGPLGNPIGRTGTRNVAGAADGAVGGNGTGAAPAAPPVNYTRRASQPAGLGALLERNYPTGARARGLEGRARVAFRVLPDGTLDVQRIVSESPPGEGFGQACMETLRRSPRWTSALDEAGEPVISAPTTFPCTFQLR